MPAKILDGALTHQTRKNLQAAMNAITPPVDPGAAPATNAPPAAAAPGH